MHFWDPDDWEWLPVISGMQNIWHNAGQPSTTGNCPAQDASSICMENHCACTVWTNPQQLCELETVYNSVMKDHSFSGEGEPLPWLMILNRWAQWLLLDPSWAILDMLNSYLSVNIISDFRASLSLFSQYRYGWNKRCYCLDFRPPPDVLSLGSY